MAYPDHMPIDQLTELEFLLSNGIHDVQMALAPSGLRRNPNHPATYDGEEQLWFGLSQLTTVENMLGVVGHTTPVERIYRQEHYPRTPIVEAMVWSVVAAPAATYDQKSSLKDVWIGAASTGSGRIYPGRLIARHAAAQIIQELAEVKGDQEALCLSGEIDDTFLTVRTLKSIRQKLKRCRPQAS